MSKNLASQTKVIHYVSAILLLILLVLQFTPFWHYGDANELATSISGYIWFPTENSALTSHLQGAVSSDFSVNNVLVPCILMLVLSAIGAVLCVIKAGNLLPSLFPAACGLTGIIGFLCTPALRLGGTWMLMLVLSIVLLLVGAYSIYLSWKQAN